MRGCQGTLLALLCWVSGAVATVIVPVPSAATLIISAYVEGSAFNKIIEIYNPTATAVNLADYKIVRYQNGGTTGQSATLTATTLASGASWVACHSSVTNSFCDQVMVLLHSGDDVVQLVRWEVCGIAAAAQDNTLIRKPEIISGSNIWNDQIGTNQGDCQWYVLPKDSFESIGNHKAVLPSAPSNSASASLFISEYIEGSSFNKAVELYNPTLEPIELSDYVLRTYINDGNSPTNHVLSPGLLAPGASYVVCRSIAQLGVPCDQHANLNHNGNDPIQLVRSSDSTIVDVIGTVGVTFGTVCGQTSATTKNTLIRKPLVNRGNTDWASQIGTNAVDCEWLVLPNDFFGDVGAHVSFFPGPTESPTQSPTTSPTAAPTVSPTMSPTFSPTVSPTFSPTMSPTFSPTASPTASPTTPCSTFVQSFTVTEGNTCNPEPEPSRSAEGSSKGKSKAKSKKKQSPKGKAGCTGKGIDHADTKDAFLALWEAKMASAPHALFGSPATHTLHDIIHDVTVTSDYDTVSSTWSHTFEVEYKPESPIDHVDFAAAGRELADNSATSISYCGCDTTVRVASHQSSYDLTGAFTGKSSPKKCKGGFSLGKAKKTTTTARSAFTEPGAVTSSVGVAAVAGVALVAVFAVRRMRNNRKSVDTA